MNSKVIFSGRGEGADTPLQAVIATSGGARMKMTQAARLTLAKSVKQHYGFSPLGLFEGGPGAGINWFGAVMFPGDDESYKLLVDQPLRRDGLRVKLDRGFDEGTYCVYVEFDGLADRVGFTAAHRHAMKYCAMLKEQMATSTLFSPDEMEDPSRSGDARKKRDLELTYLTFPIVMHDGEFHDDEVKEEFRVALLRGGQQWDQQRAGAETKRDELRRITFRRQLGALLGSDVYRHVDAKTKTHLLDDVTPLAFPSRGR